MSEFQWSHAITNSCANCSSIFDENASKSNKVNILDKTNSVDIQILDALLYMYGLSREDFAQTFPQHFDETLKYFTDVGGDEVALCYDCIQVFRDAYGMYIKFENLTKEDSLLKRAIRCSRNQLLPLKTEPEFVEDQNENDNSFNSWNSNEDNISDGASNEDSNPHSPGALNYDIKVDVENDKFSKRTKKSGTIGRRPRGRPRKVAKTGKLVIKISNRQFQSEVQNAPSSIKYENDSTFQPYIRLTRSKAHGSGSKHKKKAFLNNYGEDDVSSEDSDFEDSFVKKRKPSVKQRMIMKKYRDKPLMTTYSDKCDVKQEQESVDVQIDDKEKTCEDGIRRGLKKQFTKIRPEDGKRLVYVCNVCGKSITRIKVFKVHVNAHKKEANKLKRAVRKKVKCPHCDKLCKNEDSLKIHVSNHHSGAPKICDKCGKTFMRMESLKLHQRFSHTEDKQFECKICGMKYKWKGSLQSHELTHKNPRPHVCERCGMTFANKSNLNRHKTYHEDEEQDKELFRCQDCGKILKNRKSLKKHINGTHREDLQRIFTCSICGKTTKTRPNLKAHMKIHDPNRVMKRKSEAVRNSNSDRVENVTVIQSLHNSHALPPPVGDTYQLQVPPNVWY